MQLSERGLVMASVFVSHSSVEHELVRSLIVEPLERHGLEVWFSRDSIHGAEEWEHRIRQALLGSDWFLVALSANSVGSEWVRAEVDWAFENRRGKLVPVLIGDCNPQDCHLRLRQIQYIDLRDGNPAGKAALLNLWGSAKPIYLAKQPCAGPLGRDKPPAGEAKKKWILGLAVLAVLAMASSVWLWCHKSDPQPVTSDTVASGPPSQPPIQLPRPDVPPITTIAAPPVVVELGLSKPSRPSLDPAAAGSNDDTRVTYDYQRKDGALHVAYRLPYLQQQRAGKTIRGISFSHVPFDWELPALSVKMLNNSAQSVMVSECSIEVAVSTIDTEPVLVIVDRSLNRLLLTNEGWGSVLDPVLTFTIHGLKKGVGPETMEQHILKLPSFDDTKAVMLNKYVPKELEDETQLGVSGELEFGPAKQRRKASFTTTMIFDSTYEAPVPPSQQYDLALTAGKAPDKLRIPVAHNLKAGEADHFLLRIASDKSAHYEMKVVLRRIDGQLLPEQKLVLDVFVPRSAANRVIKAEAVKCARPASRKDE